MKHGIKKTACLILSALALEALCACSGGGINTDAPAGTDSPATSLAATEEITSEEPVTQIEIILTPEDPRLFNILFSEDANKADMSVGADGSTPENIAAAEAAMLGRYGVTLNKKLSASAADDIRTGTLSGTSEYTAVHLGLPEGVPLMIGGMLQNMSEGGIGITGETVGVNKALTSGFMFGSRLYLLFCNCLTSSLGSSYILSADITDETIKNAVLAAAETYTSAGFTLEDLLKLTESLRTDKKKDVLEIGGDMGLTAVLAGFGGCVFARDASGLPACGVKSGEFASAYEGTLKLKAAAEKSAPIKITRLSDAAPENVILPLPKLSPDEPYRTFADVTGCSVIAAPSGLANGSDLAQYVSILGMCTDDAVYGAAVKAINEKSPLPGQTVSKIADIIAGGAVTDTSYVYGWADMWKFVLSGIDASVPLASLLSDRSLDARIKTVSAAASIYFQRMN